MPGSRSSNDPEQKSPRESGEDSEEESEILEESPCGRWLKRREEVEQRDVPGIDSAYLAMDTEEGVEVVWNEVQFSERKNFKAQEEKIQQVFENLTQLEHPNIVKFHRYWTDTHNDKPRVIFITEYMSSGSLKQFLKRTKRNVKKLPLQAWKRWCTQILSALSYLHSCSPPIIHGNLTCDTIFIQHNGLVKIGSVAPDAIHHHVKTCRDNMKNMHFVAPEYGVSVTPAIDVYSFGMCALEMAALEIQGNGDSGNQVTEENINRTIESLDDEQQKDFIYKCLNKEPGKRPSARELLFHPLLFEVHSLKLLAAHALVYGKASANLSESITDDVVLKMSSPDVVVGEIIHPDRPGVEFKMADVPVSEKLEKFVEDVKYGIYPLTAFAARQPPPPHPRAASPEVSESVKSITPEPQDIEIRRVLNMMCSIKFKEETCELLMTILLRMDDKMNRHLTCAITEMDNSLILAQELVHHGFVHEADQERIAALIEETLRNCFVNPEPTTEVVENGLMYSTDESEDESSMLIPEGQLFQTNEGLFLMTSHGPVPVSDGYTYAPNEYVPVTENCQVSDTGQAPIMSPVETASSEQTPFHAAEHLSEITEEQETDFNQLSYVNGQGLPHHYQNGPVAYFSDSDMSTFSDGQVSNLTADQVTLVNGQVAFSGDNIASFSAAETSAHVEPFADISNMQATDASSRSTIETSTAGQIPTITPGQVPPTFSVNQIPSLNVNQVPNFASGQAPNFGSGNMTYAAGQIPSFPAGLVPTLAAGGQIYSFAPGQISTFANGQLHTFAIGHIPIVPISQAPTPIGGQLPSFSDGNALTYSDQMLNVTGGQESAPSSQVATTVSGHVSENQMATSAAAASHISTSATGVEAASFPPGLIPTFTAGGQIYAFAPGQMCTLPPGQVPTLTQYHLPTLATTGQLPVHAGTVGTTVLTPVGVSAAGIQTPVGATPVAAAVTGHVGVSGVSPAPNHMTPVAGGQMPSQMTAAPVSIQVAAGQLPVHNAGVPSVAQAASSSTAPPAHLTNLQAAHTPSKNLTGQVPVVSLQMPVTIPMSNHTSSQGAGTPSDGPT